MYNNQTPQLILKSSYLFLNHQEHVTKTLTNK